MATKTEDRASSDAVAQAPAGFAPPRWLAILLVVTGAAGLLAAFTLAVERVHLLENPTEGLGCDISPFVSCSGAMESWQGSLLGFPNPFIGLMAFPLVIVMGVLGIARVRMPRWVWSTFTIGVLGGLAFALWLWQQSVFELGLVCPWCFLVYMTMSAMAPTFVTWAVGSGAMVAPAALRRVAARWGSWSWVLSLVLAMVVVLVIVVRLPDIPRYLLLGY
ncbi:vitamin K epoxide reductase family protein [Agrococcus sp. SGAir0287]|uniref:vitamin K epoxide reductase family protein n=1 Tax=Agrococcus sp. SGAir0287 TaxID=2070347 RepID=UPI001586289C|nr:vitamin K epoxide reductase family protein [Agrococcus sp. SGAir0287]